MYYLQYIWGILFHFWMYLAAWGVKKQLLSSLSNQIFFKETNVNDDIWCSISKAFIIQGGCTS